VLIGGAVAVYAVTRPSEQAQPPVVTALHLADDVARVEGIDVQRNYDITDDHTRIGSSVRLVNPGAVQVTVVWFEVVPAELATSLDEVTFAVPPKGRIDGTRIAYWVVEVGPGAEQPLSWTTIFPTRGELSVDYLKRVRTLIQTESANLRSVID
jgi:hypothetical protein